MKHCSLSYSTLKTVLAIIALSLLSGCASDPRYKEGIAWVQWQEAEKQRLQAAGFPQYNHD
jgi:outer membrane biogenesis lipoprotein LolB